MIECFKTTVDGTSRIERPEPGCWVSVVSPTPEECRILGERMGIVPEFVRSCLDDEETSHIDYDDDTDQVLIIVDCPFVEDDRDSVDQTIVQYDTHPLSLLFLPEQDMLVTVSLKESDVVSAFSQGRIRGINTAQRTRLLLQILLNISQRYLVCLRSINRQFRENERKLRRSMANSELMRMLGFEKSLVYFSTSLKGIETTLARIGKGRTIRLYEEDRDLLDDVNIEIRQAIEMCNITSLVLNETMDTFGSVINNNLNITMRTLAIITLVLSMPTMVYSFYGMNTALPLDSTWVFPFVISVVLAVVSAVWILRSGMLK